MGLQLQAKLPIFLESGKGSTATFSSERKISMATKDDQAALNRDSAVGIDRDARHNPSAAKSMGFCLGVDIAQRFFVGS